MGNINCILLTMSLKNTVLFVVSLVIILVILHANIGSFQMQRLCLFQNVRFSYVLAFALQCKRM